MVMVMNGDAVVSDLEMARNATVSLPLHAAVLPR